MPFACHFLNSSEVILDLFLPLLKLMHVLLEHLTVLLLSFLLNSMDDVSMPLIDSRLFHRNLPPMSLFGSMPRYYLLDQPLYRFLDDLQQVGADAVVLGTSAMSAESWSW